MTHERHERKSFWKEAKFLWDTMNPFAFLRSIIYGEEHVSSLIWYIPSLLYVLAHIWAAGWIIGLVI